MSGCCELGNNQIFYSHNFRFFAPSMIDRQRCAILVLEMSLMTFAVLWLWWFIGLSLTYKILWPSIMTAAENGDMSALFGPLSALATADLTPLL